MYPMVSSAEKFKNEEAVHGKKNARDRANSISSNSSRVVELSSGRERDTKRSKIELEREVSVVSISSKDEAGTKTRESGTGGDSKGKRKR